MQQQPFGLSSHEIDANPFPMDEWLPAQHPASWNERERYWVLSRYDDVFRATQDWETFSSTSGNLIDEIPGRTGATLGTTDPPRHDRLRALANSAFLKKNLDHVIGPVRAIANDAIARILQQRQFDFIDDFSSIITVKVLMRMLGLPEMQPAEIRNKVVQSISTDRTTLGRHPELESAFN